MDIKKIEIGVKMLLLIRGACIRGLFYPKLPRKLDMILVRFFISS
jgi:AMMECR1 domain-containing protein